MKLILPRAIFNPCKVSVSHVIFDNQIHLSTYTYYVAQCL